MAEIESAAIAQVIAEARARRPALEVDEARFARFLATRQPLQGLRADELLLAWACVEGDRAALAELETAVLSQVPRWLSRFEGVDVDELRQLLRERLLVGPEPQLLQYRARGPLGAFVRVAAIRCAIDLQRQQRQAHGEDGLDALVADPNPEIDFIKLRDRETLRDVLREAMRGLPSRDLVLLKLHYLQGTSLERVAALYDVNRSSAARWLAEARGRALERVQSLLRERLRLSDQEQDSLLRFLDSRLDLSLGSALK